MTRRTAAPSPAPDNEAAVARVALRERLAEMQAELAQSLDERIDGGVISLLGSIHLAMLALDALDEKPLGSPPAHADGAAAGIIAEIASRAPAATGARRTRGPRR